MQQEKRFMEFIISIHALRGEGDQKLRLLMIQPRLFQSTPSVGRATVLLSSNSIAVEFQSTPSVGRATGSPVYLSDAMDISIHALRGEGDSKNIQIYNIVFVHSAYKIIYFCDSCAFYLT